MRVGLLQFGQPDDAAVIRYIKKGAANALLNQMLIEKVPGRKRVYRELKVKAVPPSDPTRFSKSLPVVVPKIKPIRSPEPLLLQYPLPDQSSYYRENRKRVWSLRKPPTKVVPSPDGSGSLPVAPPA